mgnify:CR=1 FL=1|jgi:hypothetical protein|tara:strand:- start:123 stop:2021 length:1899 start_codon:yes stop_codon:yes gene_type:complete
MASMLEYLQEMERRKAMGMTPGVPYASKYPSTSTYAPFQNLKKDLGYYKGNVGNIAASSNPETTRKAGPGGPRLTAEQIQRTASRLGQGTVKALPAFLSGAAKWAGIPGAIYSALESEDLAADQTPESLAISQAWQDANPNWTVPDQVLDNYDWVDPGGPQVILPGEEDITPRVPTQNFMSTAFEDQGEGPNVIPQDASPAVTGQYGLTQNYGGFSPVMGMLVDQVNDPLTQDMIQPYNQKSPIGLPLPKYTQTNFTDDTDSNWTFDFGIPWSTIGWDDPNTSLAGRRKEQQLAVMDEFNNSGMTIEEFSATQPSYTPGTGPSTIPGRSYHPGSLDLTPDLAGVVTHPQDMMINTPTSPADILAAAQVDTFNQEELDQGVLDRLGPYRGYYEPPVEETTTSISDYLPSFISTASANADVPVDDYQTYLDDTSWHAPNYDKNKLSMGTKDFSNWMGEQQRKETQALPTFNTTMFDDIFTDQTVSPVDTLAVKQAIAQDSFPERQRRDTQAAANVEKFVDIMDQPNVPAQPTPVVQTRRTTPAPVVTPRVSEADEFAAMVREVAHRNAIRDQVTRDLMASRDRGTPSAREIQAAINAMMGNEFGGVGGQAGMEAALGRENIGVNRSGGWDSPVG